MPLRWIARARKKSSPKFKTQAVRFVLEEIWPYESSRQACQGLALKPSVKAVTLYDWLTQSTPAKPRAVVSPDSVEDLRAH